MPKRHRNIIATGLLVLGIASKSFAAVAPAPESTPRFGIRVWQTEDELPQNSVIAMTQTRDGYLWLGTLNGLVRFDGMRFTVFDESNTPGLNSSRIVYLFEDSKENLWIGTETDGVLLARKNRPVVALDIGGRSREGRLMAAAEDSDGAVWLYTANGQLCRYRDGRAGDIFTDRPSRTRRLIAGKGGRILVGTDQLLSVIGPTAKLDPKALPSTDVPFRQLDWLLPSRSGGYWRLADWRITKITATEQEMDLGPYQWSNFTPVSAASEDTEGNLLVGTLGAGLFWFDATGKATHLSTTNGLSSDFILALHVDREGTLWVATDGGGLNRVTRQPFKVLEATRGLTAQSVCDDRQGGIWIGYGLGYQGSAAHHWTGTTVEQYSSHFPVRAILVDQKQRVWAGTLGGFGAGLFQFSRTRFERVAGQPVSSRDVSALYEDEKGRLWVGTSSGLILRDGAKWIEYTTRDGLSSDDIRAIAADKEGNVWIGTRGGGLNRFRNGSFVAFRKPDLSSDNISSLHLDKEGVLWIGTDGGGLVRFHDGKWTRYSTREGLVSNSLGYLLEDDQGYLWIGSNIGLMRASKKLLNDFARGSSPGGGERAQFVPIRAYSTPDGLPTSECTSGSQPGACRTPDGRLWFPTIKGLAYVHSAQLALNTNPPPVAIESVLIEGQPQQSNHVRQSPPQQITIPHGKERLEIQYTSLNLAAPERARFRYRLHRHETTWTEAGNSRVARYSKLPPGQYRFEVTACNEDGVWNPTGAVLGMIVQPPFWRTWWFLTAVTVVLLGSIVATVRYFATQKLQRQLAALRQREALEKERARIARDIHDQLGANLTQLALLGEMVEDDKNLPDEVAGHAQQISQSARDTTRSLDEIVWTVNPANDTLEGLVNYICKYAQDYLTVAGLRYRFEVPPQLPSITIAPEVRHNVFLAAKEAITNIVRHAKASSAWIRLQLEPSKFTIEISDDGKGIADMDEKKAATRHGLRNMRQRMQDIGGAFTFDRAPEGGMRVRLTVPSQS